MPCEVAILWIVEPLFMEVLDKLLEVHKIHMQVLVLCIHTESEWESISVFVAT